MSIRRPMNIEPSWLFWPSPQLTVCTKATDQMGWRGQLKRIKIGDKAWRAQRVHVHGPKEGRAHPLWNSWWNKGPIWIGQSIGKILGEHLKDRGLFTMNNLSTTFRIPRGRVLQGNNLGYKERRQNLTTIKVPIPPHIKVRIIYPSLAL